LPEMKKKKNYFYSCMLKEAKKKGIKFLYSFVYVLQLLGNSDQKINNRKRDRSSNQYQNQFSRVGLRYLNLKR
ncbi:hypothetical protein ABTN09_20580, partial [Acinetobacter baumannii]